MSDFNKIQYQALQKGVKRDILEQKNKTYLAKKNGVD